jgi:hypothetical protein
MNDFLRRFLRLADEKPPVPAEIDEPSLSLPERFAWYLVRRSRSPRMIECALGKSVSVATWHCEWPGDGEVPFVVPDAAPQLARRESACAPRRLIGALRAEPIGESVVRLSGLGGFRASGLGLDALRHLAANARYLLLSADAKGPEPSRVRREFEALCRDAGIDPAFAGEYAGECVALAGREAAAPVAGRAAKALALMRCYNEKDMIEECVRSLLAQGLDVFVVDDASTDGTVEILEALARSTPRLSLDKDTRKGCVHFQHVELLALLDQRAQRAAMEGYEWMMFLDVDEIRCSVWPDRTLAESFAHVESLGYNAVDFTVADFRYAKGQQMTSEPYESQMPWFEFGLRPGHFMQIKAWRHVPGMKATLAPKRGHEVFFEGRRVFPLKFLMKHYPLRGPEHARKKLYQDRFPRYEPAQVAKGSHIQYNAYRDKEPEGWNPAELLTWDERSHSRHLFERLGGVGLNRIVPT